MKDRQKKDNHNMSKCLFFLLQKFCRNRFIRLQKIPTPTIYFILFFAVERRRRFNINDRIKELGTMIPKQDT
jgi:hypothetical protein